MNKKNEFQIINRSDFSVYVDGEKIKTPEFTLKATSSYYFSEDFILHKQCAKCKNRHPVAKFNVEDKTWIEIWRDKSYKKLNSGFPSYCTQCYSENLDKRKNLDKNVTISSCYDKKKDTVVWSNKIYQYIMIRVILENKSKNEFLNELILNEMARKSIDIEMK